jgi:hypothetical protein
MRSSTLPKYLDTLKQLHIQRVSTTPSLHPFNEYVYS